MSTRSTRINCIWSIASLLLFIASTTDSAAQTNNENASVDSDKTSITSPPQDKLLIQATEAQAPADDSPPQAAVVAPPLSNPRAELESTQALYANAFAAEQYAQAVIAAAEMVTLTSTIYGSESVEYALACSDLAAVQSKTLELPAAAANYKKAIYLIEEREGIVSPRLITPLMGLASVENAAGEWDRGLETYNRALRLSHVELGLNNIEQMPIRDGLTESYLGLGSIADANFQQEVQMRIVRDEFSDDLTQLTQASNKLAGWYQRSDQQEKEVWQREMTVRSIRDKGEDDGSMQIRELRDLAAAYQRLDLSEDQALNAYNAAVSTLNEAARINNARAKRDSVIDAEIQLEIGDVHNVFGAPRDARRSYTQAWQILTDAKADTDVFEIYFGTPMHIGLTNLPALYPEDKKTREIWRANPDRFRPASLQALIDIDDYGRTDNIRIAESNPENLLDDRAISLLKRYRYRPRFENGQPVMTINLPISHAFSYLPDDDEEVAAGSSVESGSALEYPEVND